MKTIFIITSAGGSYDDAWHINLFAVTDKEAAETEVKRLTEAHEFAAEVFKELQPMMLEVYEQVRVYLRKPTPPEPKRPRGKEATKEAVAAWEKVRKEWHETNLPIWQADEQARTDIMNRGIEQLIAKARSLGCEDLHLEMLGFTNPYNPGVLTMPNFDNNVGYNYEELELR